MATIYMQCSGIQGDVTQSDHKNWSHLNSIQFHLKTPVQTKVGETSDRIKGRPVIGEVEITKASDSSSVKLMEALLNAKSLDTVKLDVCHANDSAKPYEAYILSNVLVSHYGELHHDGQHKGLESLRLNFTKIERTHTQYNSSGKAQSPCRTGYDLTSGKAS